MKPSERIKQVKKHKDFDKIKKVQVPLYPFTITFCILSKIGERTMAESKGKDTEARTEKEGQDIFIYFKKDAKIDTIIHELFHATEFIMLGIGQKIGESPNEAWAYLIGSMANEYFKFNPLK